jgi:hypothetical protein
LKYAIIYLSLGSIIPSILNQIVTHPAIVDVALGCLLGVLFGLLCACVFVGPTPAPRHAPVKATVRKPTQRRIINSTAKQPAYVFVPQNYEWSAA